MKASCPYATEYRGGDFICLAPSMPTHAAFFAARRSSVTYSGPRRTGLCQLNGVEKRPDDRSLCPYTEQEQQMFRVLMFANKRGKQIPKKKSRKREGKANAKIA